MICLLSIIKSYKNPLNHHFPMVFLCFSHDSPTFPWLSYGFSIAKVTASGAECSGETHSRSIQGLVLWPCRSALTNSGDLKGISVGFGQVELDFHGIHNEMSLVFQLGLSEISCIEIYWD